mmetsp:Transcript_4486/g.6711  ORF Transcript_4486/g.6711 Transcript_4486/m.6711 type:complete len:221 (+) Transcript_4486:6306-6968(+)
MVAANVVIILHLVTRVGFEGLQSEVFQEDQVHLRVQLHAGDLREEEGQVLLLEVAHDVVDQAVEHADVFFVFALLLLPEEFQDVLGQGVLKAQEPQEGSRSLEDFGVGSFAEDRLWDLLLNQPVLHDLLVEVLRGHDLGAVLTLQVVDLSCRRVLLEGGPCIDSFDVLLDVVKALQSLFKVSRSQELGGKVDLDLFNHFSSLDIGVGEKDEVSEFVENRE